MEKLGGGGPDPDELEQEDRQMASKRKLVKRLQRKHRLAILMSCAGGEPLRNLRQ